MAETKKISVIFGTRPEAIKLSPVVLELRRRQQFDCRVCVTGQHREMLQQVLDVFGIVPDVGLDLMQKNQTLAAFTARAISSLDAYLMEDKPDIVLVQGDTTTVLCAALTAFYHHIPVAHVEAGLRTGNLYSPWPEEGNRMLTTRLARWHFAPTETNRQNLLREGVCPSKIYVTGNTVIDALLFARATALRQTPKILGLPSDSLDFMGADKMVLITGHRRENFGEGFEHICHAIQGLAVSFPDVHFVYPVHLNPNVREPVDRILRKDACRNVHLIEPQQYLAFVALMNRADIVLTDSGGIQEEAPCFGTPVLVMRDTTERPEAVAAGMARLVGTSREKIIEACGCLLQSDAMECNVMRHTANPFGKGDSARRIADILERDGV